jgi:hypothetical protein
VANREQMLLRCLDIWNGRTSLDALDGLVTSDYVGHLGSHNRAAAQLKEDIRAYRARATDVRFEVALAFSDGDYTAMRLVVDAEDPTSGVALSACGLNISRWRDDLLAEEWALWEPLDSR